jgi:hypothetical protein
MPFFSVCNFAVVCVLFQIPLLAIGVAISNLRDDEGEKIIIKIESNHWKDRRHIVEKI